MQVTTHFARKTKDVRKFSSFLSKNRDIPFQVKMQVWESALSSSLLYSCESWLTSSLGEGAKLYKSTLEEMLGVRPTTCDELTFLEIGKADLSSEVRRRQKKFFGKIESRDHSSHLHQIITLVKDAATPMGRYLTELMATDDDPIVTFLQRTKEKVQCSSSSRRVTYRKINPGLEVFKIYNRREVLPEHQRIATTRLRLGSHRLKVETGRWARIPPERRTCGCSNGGVQDEEHVVLTCAMTEDLRTRFSIDPSLGVAHVFQQLSAADIVDFCSNVIRLTNTSM